MGKQILDPLIERGDVKITNGHIHRPLPGKDETTDQEKKKKPKRPKVVKRPNFH